MIDDLYSQAHTNSNIGIACLYAEYNDQTNQTLVHILGSLLRQLLTTAQEPIPNEVIQSLRDIQNQGRNVETKDIVALLTMRLHQLKRAFICIDAVDELEPKVRQHLLDTLKELVTNNKIHLFFTARPHIESEVQKRFKLAQRVEISATHQDIQEFVRQQIKEDYDLNPEAIDEELATNITKTIINKSQKM